MPQFRVSRPFLAVTLAAIAAAACETSKSSNPLSPSVAGPIPGVDITAPKPLAPTTGTRVAVDQQPLTLSVENATTNGARPLTYTFEVATDANFTTAVYTREGISQGDGRTSLRLPDPLSSERAYYWRARAEDGANTGPWAAANFNVVTPIVIGMPTPVSPINNSIVTSVRPRFVVGNASQAGPIGPVSYVIEVAATDSFANAMTISATQQSGQTSLDMNQDLNPNTYYFWRVRAADPTTSGPWAATQAFLTPLPAPVPPVPVPGGGLGPGDMLDLSQARVYNSPSDVANWAVTTSLTRLDLMPSGVHVEFSKQASWPDVLPPGWTGPLQYTLWIVIKVNGVWHTSGCIEFWRVLWENGGPVTGYAQNWYYDPIRWGPMTGHQPSPGEQVGFFVTSGDARNNGPYAVKERSSVVVVSFPSGGGQSFRF